MTDTTNCHNCEVLKAENNGLRERIGIMQEREQKVTSMYLPISEIRERGLSPRDIRNKVNGFAKD